MVLPLLHTTILHGIIFGKLRSRGSTRRHLLRPKGWKQFPSTKEGNRLARRLCYLSCPQILECLLLPRNIFSEIDMLELTVMKGCPDIHLWFRVAQVRAVLQERHLLRGGTADIFLVVSVSASSEVAEASQSPTHPHVTGGLWCPNTKTSNVIATISNMWHSDEFRI